MTDTICCQKLRINGTVTHEQGCPENWRGLTRSCSWCGQYFTPEDRFQRTCDHSCHVAYSGQSCDCFECFNDSAAPQELEA